MGAHLLPAMMTDALARHEIRVSRELVFVPGDDPAGQQRRLTDLLHATTGLEPDAPLGRDGEVPLPSYGLRDISLGGASLTVSPTEPAEELSRRLVRLDLALPQVAVTDTTVQFRLQLLGVVRRDRLVGDVRTLHVRYLVRLPAELEVVLTGLEQQALTVSPA
jgi:hypothetical protein